MPKITGKRKRSYTKTLPLLRCPDCGAEILLIPDLKAMSASIEDHALQHKSKIADPEKAEAETERIRSILIMRVLLKVVKLNDTT